MFGKQQRAKISTPLYSICLSSYLREARQHLAANGRVFIGFSPTIGYWAELIAIAEKYHWKLKPFRPQETLLADKDEIDDVVAGQRFEIYELIEN